MAEFPSPQATLGTAPPPVSATLLVYALFAIAAVFGVVTHGLPLIAPFVGIAGIVGIIVAYVKQGEAQGTWVASHLRWLIRTFWFSLLWAAIGAVIFVVLFLALLLGPLIAYIIWITTTIWVLYRIVRGYLLFKDSKPIPGM